MGIEIVFGVMADDLAQQIPGLLNAEIVQKKANAITLLNVHGILNDTETRKCRVKLLKSLVQGAGKDSDSGSSKERD